MVQYYLGIRQCPINIISLLNCILIAKYISYFILFFYICRSIKPSENVFVAWGALGEGWHNYHHVFPWDYKTSELSDYVGNVTTAFIDFMAKIGLAYDLKTVSTETIMKRSKRTGDGSHPDVNTWGWNDKDVPTEDREQTLILNSKIES